MNKTQIITTIGPACSDRRIITDMIKVGMSIARLNFSWGTHDEHREFVLDVRMAAEQLGVQIPIIQDLSGPRVQTGAGHTIDTDIAVITQKDMDDLEALADMQVEYVALSFVKNADDIAQLRTLINNLNSGSKIIAKIERPEAIEQIDSIIDAADGIMIARGDLGDAIPFATLPFVKKDILRRCVAVGVPAIVATEMLTSMISSQHPSRADVSDMAQAVLDGASATMLSNETAVGKYPVKAVEVMRTVVDEAVQHTEAVVARF